MNNNKKKLPSAFYISNFTVSTLAEQAIIIYLNLTDNSLLEPPKKIKFFNLPQNLLQNPENYCRLTD